MRKQPGGQDTQIVTKDSTTNLRANYMLQTADEPPAFIIVKTEGWLTGAKDVLEKVNDPSVADGINPSSYKYRVNLSMETGDERYTFLNTLMWVGSGCRRGQEGESHQPFNIITRIFTNLYTSDLRFIPRQLNQDGKFDCFAVLERCLFAVLQWENGVSFISIDLSWCKFV